MPDLHGFRPRPWRRTGVQARSAIAATAVLALLVGGGAAVLGLLLHRSLSGGVDEVARSRAYSLDAQLQAIYRDEPLDRGDSRLYDVVEAAAGRGAMVQVLDDEGRLLAKSGNLAEETPMSALRPGTQDVGMDSGWLHASFDGSVDRYRIAALGGGTGGQRYYVLVGQSEEPIRSTLKSVAGLLLVSVPVLLVAVAIATYLFVGRSLRPVDAIRRTVAGIGERDLSERVPEPDTGDAVARLAATMNAMLARLEQSQRGQRRFVADASHELRSPIATLRTAAEVAIAHPDPDPAVFPATVLAESQRLERLVHDLLLLARADERGLSPQRGEVDLDDLVDAEARRVRATGGTRVDARVAPVRVHGDRHQLSQVVRNLVDNAQRHAAGRLELRVGESAGAAELDVFDDGPGIPPADRERVFERFVRLDESRSREGHALNGPSGPSGPSGNGLGLAIVREIVTAHGGTVAVVDDPAGARFRVRLPLESPGGNGTTSAQPVAVMVQPPSSASR